VFAKPDRAPSRLDAAPSVGGVSIEWLFAGGVADVTRWSCRVESKRTTPERIQPFPAVVFVHAGTFERHDVHGKTLVEPTRLAFFNPDSPYRTGHPYGCGDRGSALVVREQVLRELGETGDAASAVPRAPFPAADVPCPSGLVLRQRLFVRRLGAGRLDPLEAEESVLRLVRAALALHAGAVSARPPRRAGRSARLRERAEGIRAFLAANYRRRPSLAGVAAHVGASPWQACRIFRDVAGVPMHRYVTRLRLTAALDALSRPPCDLSDLALDLGFSSHSHFTAVFRKEYGLTPTAFMEQQSPRARKNLIAGASRTT
jgi:AraC family transcriptional regulator